MNGIDKFIICAVLSILTGAIFAVLIFFLTISNFNWAQRIRRVISIIAILIGKRFSKKEG